jgi:hypothetical protein
LSSTHRRDIWPSRKEAAESLKKSPFYQNWDPRVLDRWINYGLRDLPTALFPELPEGSASSDPPVTLTTTRHQEVFTFSRPNYQGDPTKRAPPNRRTHPDLDYDLTGGYPFYRPEIPRTFMNLPYLRPSVMYIFAELSYLSLPDSRDDKMRLTGVGVGGSGGAAEGRVKSHLLSGVGHLIAMEAVGPAADVAAEWLGSEMQRWRADEAEFRAEWSKKSRIEKMAVDEEWVKYVPAPVRKNGANSKGKL